MHDPLNIATLDIDDPNRVAGYIWAGTDNVAGPPTYYQGVQDTNASVETGRGTNDLVFSIGHDPHEDGLLWAITPPSRFDDSGEIYGELLYTGGWAPGDRETAEYEIAGIITVMNGGTVKEWLPTPEEAAEIERIRRRNNASAEAWMTGGRK